MSTVTVATYPQVQTWPAPRGRRVVRYPETDGKPMAESDFQRKPLTYAVEALDLFFQERSDVYVSGNLFIYYEEGNPDAVVAPDVFVVFGVPKRDRPSFFTWREGKGPDFVIEITSQATRREDQGAKRALYAYLKVREYFQYDPTGDYLRPALQGFRLGTQGQYVPMSATADAAGRLAITSQVLELELRLEEGGLRFYDVAGGRRLPDYQESESARRAAEARAQQELSARQAAEARAQQELSARQAAEARAQAAEAELARLREELARLRVSRE